MSAQIDHSKHEHLYWLAEKLFSAKIFAKEVDSIDRGFAVLLAGDEMGFAPMVSARSLSFVKNKLTLNAEAQVAVCVRHSAVCLYFRLVESTAEQAVYETMRAGHPEKVLLSYTLEQARKANLLGNGTWGSHPAAMLRARCSSALAKAVYPDLVAGLVDPDEADEIRRVDRLPPAEAPTRQANTAKPDPVASGLDAYRERLAAAKSPDTLVATVLELMPVVGAFRAAASDAAGARAEALNADLPRLIAEAETFSKDPAHWSVVARALAELDAATAPGEVVDVAKRHGAATVKLPEALRARLSAVAKARRAALVPAAQSGGAANDSPAALLEDEIRRAATIPDLDATAERIEKAVVAKTITPDEAKKLVAQYDAAVAGMEKAA